MLNFVFKNNDKTIYSGECNFIVQNDEISFQCDNNNFVININGTDFLFCKEDNEIKFELYSKNDKCFSNIYLKDKDLNFDINVVFFNRVIDKNYIKFEYILESDEKSVKSLEIRYWHRIDIM